MVFRRLNRRMLVSVDWQMITLITLLCVLGLVVLQSAGYDHELGYSPSMKRQAASMAIGALFFFGAMFFSTTFWKRMSVLIYVTGVILLLGVMFGGVVAGGARRWLDLGFTRIQPSEFVKIGVILFLARVLGSESAPKDGYTLKTLWLPGLVLGVPFALILRQPDLGTGLCVVLIGGSMLLVAGIRIGTLLRLVLCGALLAVPAWNFLEDYQRQRVMTFLQPEADPLGTGYHAMQSKIAVGSGALTGKGFLQGTQTQLRFLPEQTTDFIFSVLAEEWGFIGSMAVIVLYCLLIFRLLTAAQRSEEPFQAFVAFGVAAMLFWHTLINIGMVTGVVPVVGITLKLLSYGGSSTVTMLAALGVVTGFSLRKYMFA